MSQNVSLLQILSPFLGNFNKGDIQTLFKDVDLQKQGLPLPLELQYYIFSLLTKEEKRVAQKACRFWRFTIIQGAKIEATAHLQTFVDILYKFSLENQDLKVCKTVHGNNPFGNPSCLREVKETLYEIVDHYILLLKALSQKDLESLKKTLPQEGKDHPLFKLPEFVKLQKTFDEVSVYGFSNADLNLLEKIRDDLKKLGHLKKALEVTLQIGLLKVKLMFYIQV